MKNLTLKTEEGGILKDGDDFWYVDGLCLKHWRSHIMAPFAENLTFLRDKSKKYFLTKEGAEAFIKYKLRLHEIKIAKNLEISK